MYTIEITYGRNDQSYQARIYARNEDDLADRVFKNANLFKWKKVYYADTART
jgi:hypothetical protein